MVKKLDRLNRLETVYANGLLFVGDPHLTAIAPARRLDDDFQATLRDKLMQIAAIANEHFLSVVILGDLFDRARELNADMLSDLFEFLSRLDKPAYCLAGNHDLTETKLTADVTLSVVEKTGLLNVVSEAGLFARFMMEGKTVTLGGTPSGMAIPDTLPLSDKGITESDHNIWITHEDLAFPGAYPNALEFKEIEHVELVVNGHMHLLQPEHVEGQTTWFNPGNIVRKTVSDKDHVPAVYSWRPEAGLQKHRLSYKREIFNLAGYHVDSANEEDIVSELKLDEMSRSMFVDLLQNDIMDGAKTQDGGLISELTDKIKHDSPLSEGAELIINRLLNKAVESDKKAA